MGDGPAQEDLPSSPATLDKRHDRRRLRPEAQLYHCISSRLAWARVGCVVSKQSRGCWRLFFLIARLYWRSVCAFICAL